MTARVLAIIRSVSHRPGHQPKTTVAIAALCAAVALVGALRLRPAASLHEMFGSDNPTSRALGIIADEFPAVDDLLVVVTADEATVPDEPRAALLAFARRLEDAIERAPRLSERIATIDIGGQPSARQRELMDRLILPAALLYLTESEFAALRQRLTGEAMREQMARNETLMAAPGVAADAAARAMIRDPLRLREILGRTAALASVPIARDEPDLRLSHDGRSLLIRIFGRRSVNDLEFSRALVRDVQAAIAPINVDGLGVEYSGAYAIAARSEHLIRRDMISSMALTAAMIAALFLIVYRSGLEIVLAASVVTTGIVVGFGVYSVFRSSISPATAAAGAVLAGLGVDYTVHLVAHARAGGAAPGSSCAAINASLDVIGPAVLTAGLTTIIGFISVAQASEYALRDFGLLGALGLSGVLVATFMLLPAVYSLRRRPERPVARRRDHWTPIDLADRHPGRCAAVTAAGWAAALIVMLSAGRLFTIETDLTVMHPRPNRPLELQQEVAHRFGAPANSVILLVEAGTDRALVERAHAARIALDGPRLAAAGLTGTFGIASLLPDPDRVEARLEQIRRIDVEAVLADFQRIAGDSAFNPAAFDDYAAALRTMLSVRTPPTLDELRGHADVIRGILPRAGSEAMTASPPRCVMLAHFSDSLDSHARRAEAVEALEAAVAELPGVTVTGLTAMGYHAESIIRRDLIRTMSFAAGCSVLLLLALVRRPGAVLLILMPTAFGLCWLLAAMHLTGERFNTLNIIGVPLLLGIGVDDGIFLVGIAARHRRRGGSRADLARDLRTSCRAVIMTSATTMLAFGSLVFSSTPAIGSLGRLTAIGVGSCLLASLFLLAPILLWRHRGGPESAADSHAPS